MNILCTLQPRFTKLFYKLLMLCIRLYLTGTHIMLYNLPAPPIFYWCYVYYMLTELIIGKALTRGKYCVNITVRYVQYLSYICGWIYFVTITTI